MNLLLLISLAAAVFLATTEAKPADIKDAVGVEIQKQRLIKFPDELDSLHFDTSKTTQSDDEAKRILKEIAKINQALGYVKKSEEPQRVKLPPILDSTQYLFPKPTYHPFHGQKHQVASSNGATLLLPSIRSLSSEHIRGQQLVGADEEKPAIKVANKEPIVHIGPTQYFFRPNQFHSTDSSRLDEHYAIPVRLYKLNKEEYIRKHAPQEYRLKGYKIVGDVDHFNGRIKSKDSQKTTPKYHLFFLPRELALKEEKVTVSQVVTTTPAPTTNRTKQTTAKPLEPQTIPQESAANSSREEKLTLPRPFKNQLSSNSINNGNTASVNNSSTPTTQIIRKRIIPKPLKQPTPQNVESVVLQQKPIQAAPTLSKIRITPPPTVAAPTTSDNELSEANESQVQISTNFENTQTNKILKPGTNAIKTAFQNIFKFPFRQQPQPTPMVTERPQELQAVQLQQQPQQLTTQQQSQQQTQQQSQQQSQQLPQKTFLAAQHFLSQPFLPQNLLPQNMFQQNTLPQAIYSNQQQNSDYNWDDEEASNSGSSSSYHEDVESHEDQQEQKHYFQNAHNSQQQTQKEALRQGGIIIQRLKVRKGGIAIAGPGGVATAGSGGTAIVGPGGYALTHPRSLTIAGPGAKVIAIPADIDLQDALDRTDLSTQSFPREGRIVATGPTVYYAPSTGTGAETIVDY